MTLAQGDRVRAAAASVAARAGGPVGTGIILGSGLGGLAVVEEAVAIPYGEIDGFPVPRRRFAVPGAGCRRVPLALDMERARRA